MLKEVENIKVKKTRPNYYKKGKIEVWDFIIDKEMNFLEGNIVKYISRYKEKNGLEDLEKAREYLNRLIHEYSKELIGVKV